MIKYDPTSRNIEFTAIGSNTVAESTDSLRVDPQTFCDPPETMFEGSPVGTAR